MFLRSLGFAFLMAVPLTLIGQASSAQVVTTPAPIPANQVNLSDYGGVPGASRTAIANAFNQAFTRLKSLGGGTLNIAPGTYDYGDVNSTQYMVMVSDLNNVLVKGYGAKFTMNTAANPSYAHFFGIRNSNNVTIAGLAFYDFSPVIGVGQTGALCFDLITSKPSKQFKTVDIQAEHVHALFRSYPGPTDGTAYTGTEFDINGTLKEGYYGMIVNYNGRFSKANLTVHNVRRAFISYGTRDWDLKFTASSTGARGSDGLVDFIPLPGFPVQDTKVVLNFSGVLNYSALIHFYNQGSATGATYTRNVRAHVNLTNVTPDFNKSIFYHGFAGNTTTTRPFENIYLSGTLNSTHRPVMISSPAVSTAPTSSVYVSQTLSTYQNMATLPSYFRVIPDWDIGTTPPPPSPTTTTMPSVTTTTLRPPTTTTIPPTTTTLRPPTTTTVLTPAPATWIRCAVENGVCTFTGTRQVRYGANGIYAFKTATGSIGCDNNTFGDPLFGTVKACDYSSTVVSSPVTTTTLRPPTTTTVLTPAPATWIRCAVENGICSFTGTRQVRYGANGIYSFKTATGSIGCDNNTFGDPVFGTVKACDYSSTVVSTPVTTTLPPAPVTTTTLRPVPTTTTLRPPTTTTMPPTTTTTTLPPAPTGAWPVLQSIPIGTRPIIPNVAMPGYLSWIVDTGSTNPYTTSGTPVSEITRVSDAATFGLPAGTALKLEYSKTPPWNSDDTQMIINVPSSTGYNGALLDGKTFKFIRLLRNAGWGRWGNSNPRLYFKHNNNGVLAVTDIPTDTATTVRNFSDLGYVGNGGVGMFGGEGRQDNNDRMFPLLLQKSSGQYDIVNYDRIANTVTGTIQLSGKPGPGTFIDWWSASQTGKFIITGTMTAWTSRDGISVPAGVNIWTPQGQLLRTLNTRAGNHLDAALDLNGEDVIFFVGNKTGFSGRTGQTWRMDGSQGSETTVQFVDMVGYNYHISATNTKKPGYGVVTSFGSATPSSYNTFPMWNHTFAVRFDGSRKVAPLATLHHSNAAQTVNDYARQPFGAANRSLTSVLWGGTWGDADVSGPIHSFVARPRLVP